MTRFEEMSSTVAHAVSAIHPGKFHKGVSLSRSSPVEESPSWNFEANMGMFGLNVKEEPMDDTRNDSGVTSGSDCPSASPASDRSDSHPGASPPQNNAFFPRPNNSVHDFNPWNPANSQMPSNNQSLTDDSKRQLLNQSNNNRLSVSPKPELLDENSNDGEGIRVPKINSHGKVKINKCKQCDFYSYTKLDFWQHSRVHIKGDKILKCPKCPFVTEYKHHLEYHLLNHAGAKPFKCQHCDYSCVNKSMLNSHLKSHSKIYQYRCADCLYETKYCHSLKLHLRKYRHKPAMVLNPDGSPNPLPIIDVYGTRRGPKVKKTHEPSSSSPTYSPSSNAVQPESQPPPMPQLPFNPLMNPLLSQNPMLPFPLPILPAFAGAMSSQAMFQNFQNMVKERLEELTKQDEATRAAQQLEPEPEVQENGALDLTNKSSHSSENGESDDEYCMTAFENVEVVENKNVEAEETLTPETAKEAAPEAENKLNVGSKFEFACQFCCISFADEVMFTIHMGYHGFKNPFTCNMCGEECENKVNFFLHIARAAH